MKYISHVASSKITESFYICIKRAVPIHVRYYLFTVNIIGSYMTLEGRVVMRDTIVVILL